MGNCSKLLDEERHLTCHIGYCSSARTRCCRSYGPMVARGSRGTRRGLDRCILHRRLHYQLVRCHGIRRRRVLGLYLEALDDRCLPLHGCDLRLWWWTLWRSVSIILGFEKRDFRLTIITATILTREAGHGLIPVLSPASSASAEFSSLLPSPSLVPSLSASLLPSPRTRQGHCPLRSSRSSGASRSSTSCRSPLLVCLSSTPTLSFWAVA